MNYHLKAGNYDKETRNFSGDLQDSRAYSYLLSRLRPGLRTKEKVEKLEDLVQRAEIVIKDAKNLGCYSYVKPEDISEGNSKLNMIFSAEIFNTYSGLEPMPDIAE
mmetsp:Transcript_5216/g.2975  ORF Transcript_5216/g.2975 Transcript_5216/m.2975 type:complete len:106 (+) Transcript_5216:774-1091(+)